MVKPSLSEFLQHECQKNYTVDDGPDKRRRCHSHHYPRMLSLVSDPIHSQKHSQSTTGKSEKTQRLFSDPCHALVLARHLIVYTQNNAQGRYKCYVTEKKYLFQLFHLIPFICVKYRGI